jgi:hypothetical protein
VSFPVALLVTLAVEVPLYVVALFALRLCGTGRAVLLGTAVNLLTHPVLWWCLAPRPALAALVAAEVAVWAVETGLVWLALRRAFTVLAVVCAGVNAASILAGLLISAVA